MRPLLPFQPCGWPLLTLAALHACTPPPPAAAPPDQVVVQVKPSRVAAEGGGVVLPNAGRIQGVVYGPAPGLVTREFLEAMRAPLEGALVLRQIREGQADPGTTPLPGVQVTAVDASGAAVSTAVLTDAQGVFKIDALQPSGPMLYLRASFPREGCAATMLALAPAPRPVGYVMVNVTPSSTLVCRKALAQIRNRLLNPLLLPTSLTDRVAATFASVLSDRAITTALCLRDPQGPLLFDTVFAGLPELFRKALRSAGEQLDAEALFDPFVSPREIDIGPTLPPSAPPDPFESLAPAGGGSPAPAASNPAVAPGIATPAPGPSVPRVAIRTLATATGGARVELPPEGLDADLYAPSDGRTEGARIESLEASLTLRDLERGATAICFEGDTIFELQDDRLRWNDRTLTVAGTGASTYADLAVRDGHAYLIGVEPHNVVRVSLTTGETQVLAGQATANGGGMRDGTGPVAEFDEPRGIVAAPDALYVADSRNHRIRRITYEGVVTTFAGGENAGVVDGTGALARFRRPMDLTRDAAGNLYVADADGHCIRRVSPSALVRTLTSTSRGNTDGAGGTGLLDSPTSVTWGRVAGTEVLIVAQASGVLRLLTGW